MFSYQELANVNRALKLYFCIVITENFDHLTINVEKKVLILRDAHFRKFGGKVKCFVATPKLNHSREKQITIETLIPPGVAIMESVGI